MTDIPRPIDSKPIFNPARRRASLSLAAGALTLTGCGGGGGGGGAETPTGQDPTVPDPATTTGGSRLPPRTGSFGGGQGQILFVAGGDYPTQVIRFDLASRQLVVLGTFRRAERTGFHLVGGVTRANDGSFLVADYQLSLNEISRLYHCAPDGTVIRSVDMVDTIVNGASLSPDGRTAAYVNFAYGDGWKTINSVFVVDLASARTTRILLVDPNPALLPEGWGPSRGGQTIWAPDGTLYVLNGSGLSRVDIAAGTTTPLHVVALEGPDNSVVTPDGREIWFDCKRDGIISKRLWSMDIASGALKSRSVREQGGDHFAPNFSPDGQWLLLQDIVLTYVGIGISSAHYIAAIRGIDTPFDTHKQSTEIWTADGVRPTASRRMAWY